MIMNIIINIIMLIQQDVITWRAGSVLITIPTMETNTKLMEMMETTLMGDSALLGAAIRLMTYFAAVLDSGFSMRSHTHF